MNKIKFPSDTKECLECKNIFEKRKNCSWAVWRVAKFCSRKCHGDSLKGKAFFDSTGVPSWNKGKKNWMSEEGRKKIGEFARANLRKWTPEQRKERYAKTVATRKAKGNYNGQLGKIGSISAIWKGDKASYNSKHKWIQKHWAKTGICENCGNRPKPYSNGRLGTEFHSKDHKYNRDDRATWLEVCKSCHNKLDKYL